LQIIFGLKKRLRFWFGRTQFLPQSDNACPNHMLYRGGGKQVIICRDVLPEWLFIGIRSLIVQ